MHRRLLKEMLLREDGGGVGTGGRIISPQWRSDFCEGKKKEMLDVRVSDHHAILRKVCQVHQKFGVKFAS